ncbi:MAG: PAS domain-containing protein [Verrucomicrobiota bacterium]
MPEHPHAHFNELCARIVNATPDAVFLCGLDGRLLLANPAFAAMLGKPAEEILGRDAAQLNLLPMGGMIGEQNALVLSSGRARTFELSEFTPNGLCTVLITKGILHDANGAVQGVYGIARDISESRGIEQEIINTSDREKQRLGRELRENFCQHLVGISLLGNVLYEELSRTGIEQADFARQIAHLVKEVVSEVRTLEKGLSVTHLEQGEGLVEALEDLAEQVRSGGEIECVFHAPASRPLLEPQTAMYLFRIAQEAVHNAVTHSQARGVQIRLSMKRDVVVLSVRDDGVGFQKSESAPFETRAQIGFPIMHYRSRAIGAKLEIKHRPRGGIEVISTVPRRKAPRKRR